MSMIKLFTKARKCRQKIMLGMAINKPNPVLYKATEIPCASCTGLLPVGACDPKISIIPTTVPNSPINGLIEAIVPSVVR